MKFLVAGGAGFLGSHLCRRLIEEQHEVICVDNFYTGNADNLEDLRLSKLFTFVEHDITEKIKLKVDGVFNLACPASPVHYQTNPTQTFKTSVIGTLNLIELARINDARFFQASTSEIYGDPLVNPQSEEYWGNVNPIGIRACYDEGKRAAETITIDYNRQYGLDIRIARIFNTYGPRMSINDGRVVSNFIVQALQGRDITVYGDGSQMRSFCYVDDLIEGFVRLFFKKEYFQVINLGNPEPVAMIQLAREIIHLTGSNSKIKFDHLPSDDPKQREPDITRAKRVLGWEPKIDRNAGLIRTIDFFKQNM